MSGLTHLNVSVDSLDPARFHQLTGRDQLKNVIEGIDTALAQNFTSVKVNSVLHKDHTMEEFDLFLAWIRNRPVSVRFIELMKTGDQAAYAQKNFLSSGILKHRLLSEGWKILPRQSEDGPAIEFSHPDYQGRMGIIAPYSDDFCTTCNRLRITSRGKLRLCLFGEEDHSIRPWLQSETLAEALPEKIQTLLQQKTATHFLNEGKTGKMTNFSSIGG